MKHLLALSFVAAALAAAPAQANHICIEGRPSICLTHYTIQVQRICETIYLYPGGSIEICEEDS